LYWLYTGLFCICWFYIGLFLHIIGLFGAPERRGDPRRLRLPWQRHHWHARPEDHILMLLTSHTNVTHLDSRLDPITRVTRVWRLRFRRLKTNCRSGKNVIFRRRKLSRGYSPERIIHTHTHTHTRARAHTHTHTHILIYSPERICRRAVRGVRVGVNKEVADALGGRVPAFLEKGREGQLVVSARVPLRGSRRSRIFHPSRILYQPRILRVSRILASKDFVPVVVARVRALILTDSRVKDACRLRARPLRYARPFAIAMSNIYIYIYLLYIYIYLL